MAVEPIILNGTSGKGVVLIHGLTGAPNEMRLMARALNRRGFTVHVPLLAGHGIDAKTLLKTDRHDWLASVQAAYDRLAPEVDEVHAGGVCAGAGLAVLLAATRPVARVATFSMAFCYDGWAVTRVARTAPILHMFGGLPLIRRFGFAERPPYGIKDDRIREFVTKQLHNPEKGMLDHFPLGALSQMYRMGADVARAAPQVRAPTLLFHAREDDLATLENSRRLYKLLGGPKRIEILEDSYHLVHVDRQSAHVAALTAQHFDPAVDLDLVANG